LVCEKLVARTELMTHYTLAAYRVCVRFHMPDLAGEFVYQFPSERSENLSNS